MPEDHRTPDTLPVFGRWGRFGTRAFPVRQPAAVAYFRPAFRSFLWPLGAQQALKLHPAGRKGLFPSC